MILLVLLCFIIYGTFKIPMNKKWSIYLYDILFCLISFIFYALISADQEHGSGAGALIIYIYITMLLPIMIITKFIINMVFSYLNLDYGFHIVSMCILLIFLVYLSAPNNDHSYRFLIYLILQFIFINLSYFIYFYSYCIIINGQIIKGNIIAISIFRLLILKIKN